MVVFSNGERALQASAQFGAIRRAILRNSGAITLTPHPFRHALQLLPPLVGVVPEARLNLVIYHMHNNEVQEAFELMKDIEPASPQEYILKGVTNLALGQQMDSREHLKV